MKRTHKCDKLPKNEDGSLATISRHKKIWTIYYARVYAEDIKFCPYCGYDLNDDPKEIKIGSEVFVESGMSAKYGKVVGVKSTVYFILFDGTTTAYPFLKNLVFLKE